MKINKWMIMLKNNNKCNVNTKKKCKQKSLTNQRLKSNQKQQCYSAHTQTNMGCLSAQKENYLNL